MFEFIEGFYNPTRRHSSIGYFSPIEYEKQAAQNIDRDAFDPDAPDPAAVLAAAWRQRSKPHRQPFSTAAARDSVICVQARTKR